MLDVIPLDYQPTGIPLVSRLRDRAWLMWLDSGRPVSERGRYDVVVADPVATLVGHEGDAVLCVDGVSRRVAEPMGALRELLRSRQLPAQGLPFCGGALGYFSYDFGARAAGRRRRFRSDLPEIAVGIYDWAVITDHEARTTCWVGRAEARTTATHINALLRQPAPADGDFDIAPPSVTPDDAGYRAAFEAVRRYIRDGDCYQVNLARLYRARYNGDPWSVYLRLRWASPVPFGAYLKFPFAEVLSVSPERFLKVDGARIETWPIKGTRPRRPDPEADRAERDALLASAKDRAENVMIVDLLRNDLGRVCVPGSIEVPVLCALETFANVHHLVSSVTGRLAPGRSALDALMACLPGGSITGAPKIRAMDIIDELEPAARGIYCGAIGYISDDGRMDTNIAIRTAVCAEGEIRYWSGGGLVADSDVDAELQETVHKAAPFLALAQAEANS